MNKTQIFFAALAFCMPATEMPFAMSAADHSVNDRISITNIHDGDRLSGHIAIPVALGADVKPNGIDFTLDGRPLPQLDLRPAFRVLGPHRGLLHFQTDYLPNGSHHITVTDKQGDSDTRTVVFDNKIRLPRFRIRDIYDGQILSGDVFFGVAVFDGSLAGDIDMVVDGHDYGPSNAYTQPQGYALERQDVNTNYFRNGPHTLTILDSWGNRDSRTVIFGNALSRVFYDVICDVSRTGSGGSRIAAQISPAQTWRVEIQDDRDKAVRTYQGDGDRIDIFWGGRDDHGRMLPDGAYSLVMAAQRSRQTFLGSLNKYSTPLQSPRGKQ